MWGAPCILQVRIHCLYFVESFAIQTINTILLQCSFVPTNKQTCSRKHHEVLDLKNLLALVIRFCVCIALEASSSSFVSFDSWKRQRAHDSIIPISCWLGNIQIFHAIHLQFLSGLCQTGGELTWQQYSHHGHSVVLSLDGGLDSRSVSVFIICF